MVRGLGECIGGAQSCLKGQRRFSEGEEKEGGKEDGTCDKEGEESSQQGQNRDEDLGLVENSVNFILSNRIALDSWKRTEVQ